MLLKNKTCRVCGESNTKELWVLDHLGILCTLHAMNELYSLSYTATGQLREIVAKASK